MKQLRIVSIVVLALLSVLADSSAETTHRVEKVVDSKIHLDNGETVSLLGVAENGHSMLGGYLADLIGTQPVELIFDKYVGADKNADGNVAAYVYVIVPEDHPARVGLNAGLAGVRDYLIYDKIKNRIFLNGSAVWSGNALMNSEIEFEQKEKFKRYEREAQKKRRGVWAAEKWKGLSQPTLKERVEAVFMVAIPVLFWAGLITGIIRSTFTSSPHLLGNKWLSKGFLVVAALFLVNLAHGIGVPFLFGQALIEYSIIIGLVAVFVIVLELQEKSQVEAHLAQDPRLKRCPKCKAVVDKIVAECPKCETAL